MFYEYLVNQKYIQPTKTLNKLVELTRKYDTWEWKKDNDLSACHLTWLFNACGIEKYLEIIFDKINEDDFTFNTNEYEIINNWKKDFDSIIRNIVNDIIYLNICGYKAGVVKSIYEYRNDIAEHIRENNYDIDFLAIVFTDKLSVSYRAINNDVDVNEIAKCYGGKGHVKAASSPITEEERNDIEKYFDK